MSTAAAKLITGRTLKLDGWDLQDLPGCEKKKQVSHDREITRDSIFLKIFSKPRAKLGFKQQNKAHHAIADNLCKSLGYSQSSAISSNKTWINQPFCTNKYFSKSCNLLVLLNRQAAQTPPTSESARCDEEEGSSNVAAASAPLGYFSVCCGWC